MLRSTLLFIHVLSAMGLFAALGMEAVALAQLRQAEEIGAMRTALAALGSRQRVAGPSALLLVLSGIALVGLFWRGNGGAWMGLGFVGLLVVAVIGGLMTGRRVRRLQKSLTDARPASLTEIHPALRTSLVIRAALLAGIVYLMTAKPG